ncbi:MAG: hypothetical protein ACLFO1_02565 [Spirochaetaceae bacterium]
MYLFLWELGSYRQLSRLRPELVKEVENELHDVLASGSAELVAGEQGARLYAADPVGEDAPRRMSDVIARLLGTFGRYREELAGYGVIVDRGLPEGEASLRRLQGILRAVPDDEAVWLTDPVSISLSSYLAGERMLPLTRVLGLRDDKPTSTLGAREIAANAPDVETVLEALDPWLRGDGAVHAAVLSGLSAPSAQFIAECALEKLYGGARDWLRVAAVRPGRSWRYAFAADVDEAFLARVPSLLTAAEGDVWARTRRFIDGAARSSSLDDMEDRVASGFAVAYKLYWNARLRSLRAQLLPAVAIVSRADLLPPPAQAFLQDLLDDGESGGVFVMATAPRRDVVSPIRGDDAGDTRTGTVVVELHPLDPMEIAQAARRNLPESATRRFRVAAAAAVTGGDPLVVHHHLKNLEADEGVESRSDPKTLRADAASAMDTHQPESMRYIGRLPSAARDVLFLCHTVSSIGGAELVAAVAGTLGHDEVTAQACLQDLVAHGFISDPLTAAPYRGLDVSRLSREASARYAAVTESAGNYLVLEFQAGRRSMDRGMFRLIADALGETDRRRAASRLFEALLFRGAFAACADLLAAETARLNAVPGELREPARQRAVVATWRLRLALATNDAAGAAQASRELPGPTHESWIDGRLYLAQALYNHGHGDIDKAISAVKRSIVSYQSTHDEVGAASANVEYARLLMGRGAVLEAFEQLNRGRMGPVGGEEDRVGIQRAVVDAVVSFVYGNLTRAWENTTWLRRVLADVGQREALLFADLMRGRLLFEMGTYEDAAEWFQQARTEARRLGHSAALRVFEVWLARTEAYAGRTDAARRRLSEVEPTPETLFFRAEAHWLANELDEAVAAADAAVQQQMPRTFVVPEHFDWSTGFSSIEEQLAPGRGDGADAASVIMNLIRAFRAFLYGRVGRTDEGIPTLRKLTRGEDRRHFDPYAGLYCLFYCKTLPGVGDEMPDNPVTMLGKAVKFMQERMARMDSPQDRNTFFKHNYWYQLLLADARKHNMV